MREALWLRRETVKPNLLLNSAGPARGLAATLGGWMGS
jgi:hypothetical protein